MKAIYFSILLLMASTCARPLDYVADWPQDPERDHPILTSGNSEGPLRKKANEYDVWNAKFFHPYYGGVVGVRFSDKAWSQAESYTDMGDSCIWTGIYLGSQAFRHAVTKDPVAKENIIKSARSLDGNLHVTGARGYIARYRGPRVSKLYSGDTACDQNVRCHRVSSGKYAGDFWEGGTSKDQYSGWFFGMTLAYEFVDDEATKKMIRDDIVEVVDQLIDDGWIIRNEKRGYDPISTIHRPSYEYQLSWLNAAYHVTGADKYKAEIQKRLNGFDFFMQDILVYTDMMNRYTQYYGNNIDLICWLNLLRLGRVYYSPEAYARLKHLLTTKIRITVELAHNPWFNGIFMSQGEYVPTPGHDPYKEQLIEDLTDFLPVPHYSYALPQRDPKSYELDPVTSWTKYFPRLQEILGSFAMRLSPQALKAFPIRQQCFAHFMFEKTPFSLGPCGEDNPKLVQPGHDYLAAYWLASYYGYVDKSQQAALIS